MSTTIQKMVSGRDYFRFHPDSAALLVIDMQNSFVAEGAWFEAPKGRDIIPAINALIEEARRTGVPVIWTQSDHSPPGGGLILQRYPVIKETSELWLGDPSFELYPDMVHPLPGEHRIVKHKYDAFHDTDLDTVLKNLGKDTVILTGVAAEVCCESTARAAFFNEYKVVMVGDATASFEPDDHQATLDRIDVLFGRVMSADEVLAAVREGRDV